MWELVKIVLPNSGLLFCLCLISQTMTLDRLVSKPINTNCLSEVFSRRTSTFWLRTPGGLNTKGLRHQLSRACRLRLELFLSQPIMKKQLTSLTQWSQEHIRDVFESISDEDSAKAVEHTFSKSINATVNDKQLGYADIKHLVPSMRKEAPNGLKVQWQQTVDVPCDSTNRVRSGCLSKRVLI